LRANGSPKPGKTPVKTIEDIELMQPGTLAEALAIMADEKTRGVPLAGGTDLMVQWQAGVRPIPDRAVSLAAIAELRDVSEAHGRLLVGAAVTHRELRHAPLVNRLVPCLAAAAATVGGLQIQAMGTIGGSIANASPAGDLGPSLLVAGGDVLVASAGGERRIALDRFLLGYRKIDLRPDELLVRFELNALPEGQREGFRKLGPRAAQAISKVMGSYRGGMQGGRVAAFRVALGSVAPTAVLLDDIETFVVGKALDASVLDEAERLASRAVKPITDIRSSAEYRAWVSGRLVRFFLEDLSRGTS
jgi:CO/xanthine dehydrogenase FAD-binding subunit